MIGAMRNSICHTLQEVDNLKPFLDGFLDWLGNLPTEQRQMTPAYLSSGAAKTYTGFSRYDAKVYPCHLDPQSFHQIYKWYVPALAKRFNMSYGEVVSIQTTFDYMAKTHYYFGVVAEAILGAPRGFMDEIIFHNRGYKIGYYILSLMLNVKGRVNSPPCRFNDYKEFQVGPMDDWIKTCEKKTRVMLHLCHHYVERPEEKDVTSAYKKSLNLLKKTVDGAGPLITNHSVAIMASIGLLPMWYMTTALIPTDSKYMRHFKRTFELPDLDDNVIGRIRWM